MTRLETRESATGTALDETTAEKTAATTTLTRQTSPQQHVAKGKSVKGAKQKVSRWKKVGRAIARHPRITTTALLFTLASGTGVVLLCLLFKGAWSGHRDNVSILRTIWEMEVAREDTLAINDNTQQVVTRTYLTLEAQVAQDDWTWINRFGSTITYGKQNQRLIASCSAYSPLYLVCDLSEIP
ncbi:MAG: hypothetical protein AAFP03_05375 [Cyanobacteria bacterium J06598_3]